MHTLKKLTAAVAIAMSAGAAEAAIIQGDTGPGELFINVFDSVAQQSYHLDLGITTAQLLANPSQTLVFNLFADTNYAGFITPQSPLVFNIAGYNNNIDASIPEFGFLVTSNDTGAATPPAFWDYTNVANGGGKIGIHEQGLNAPTITTSPNANGVGNGSGLAGPADGNAYYAASTWNANFGGGIPFTNEGSVNTPISFWHWGSDDNGIAIATELSNDWILTSAGKLCYGGTECSPAAVPVPAAIWLFGSGLVGMVGVARRTTTLTTVA